MSTSADQDLSLLVFSRPSLIEGAARGFDMFNTMYEHNQSLSPTQADILALRSDWLAIRADLENAVERFRAQYL